ncbi:MAG: hypothetical protein RLO52_34165 [Sandaracinaceae bacterium]
MSDLDLSDLDFSDLDLVGIHLEGVSEPYLSSAAETDGDTSLDQRLDLTSSRRIDITDWEWPKPFEELAAPDGKLPQELPKVGVLKLSGYSVGRTGIASAQHRSRILAAVFELELPGSWKQIVGADNYASWGTPRSGRRLYKLAYSLAAFIKRARRRENASGVDLTTPKRRWGDDLQFLYSTYYEPAMASTAFAWPDVSN